MSATDANSHRTGTVASGDVEIFYRHFGSAADQAPILILHGAYDSADWVQVAAELAADGREVVAFDARGYGRSSWSPSANYSLDAQLSDIAALTGHLGWERPVLLGHSRGGSFTLRYTHALPDRVGAAIFADSCPGRTARGPAPVRAGGAKGAVAEQPVYATLADALASTSRDPSSLERPAARARLEQFFTQARGDTCSRPATPGSNRTGRSISPSGRAACAQSTRGRRWRAFASRR